MDKDLSNKLAESMRKNNLLDATKKIDKKPEIHVGHNEFKAMKKQNYEENKSAPTSYVIENKKTGAIVEINAVSAMVAAKTVGWRPRHTRVLKINNPEDNPEETKGE
jgi:hypothetical protein